MVANTTPETKRARLGELTDEARGITDAAKGEGRGITADERTRFDAIMAEAGQIDTDLRTAEDLAKLEDRTAPLGRVTTPTPAPAATPRVTGGATRNDDQKRWGFDNVGDFARAVSNASKPGGLATLDPRIEARADPSTYGNEASGPDGGFAVPPDFVAGIVRRIEAEDSILGLTQPMTSGSNTHVVPADEATPWGSAGIQAYWEAEMGAALTQSKPALKQLRTPLHKVTCLVPVSDELLEDAAGLGSYINQRAPEVVDFKVALAIVQGTGAGQPLGVLNAASTVSVAKKSGQAADTVVGENIDKIWARMYAPFRRDAVWLVNQDIEPQLAAMAFSGDDRPLYVPAGGLSARPYDTLKGRPVLPTQACETLGDKGDMILFSPSQYLSVTKAGGVQAATSVHLWFDWDATAFRFILRVGGQPWLSNTVSARDGSTTYGSAVTLDERA